MSDEALLYGTGLTDKPKYTAIEYQKMINHIHNQISEGNEVACLKDAEQFEKAVWAFGVLKSNNRLNGNEDGKLALSNKRNSPETKRNDQSTQATKAKRKRTK